MATITDVLALGYEAPLAMPGVYYVSGFGISTYVNADDQAQIDSLADPVLHAERVRQFKAPSEQTLVAESAPMVAVVPQLDPKTASLADVIAVVNELSAS